jgi:hypothetical protein
VRGGHEKWGSSAGKDEVSVKFVAKASLFPAFFKKPPLALPTEIGDNAQLARLRALLSLTLAAARHCAL